MGSVGFCMRIRMCWVSASVSGSQVQACWMRRCRRGGCGEGGDRHWHMHASWGTFWWVYGFSKVSPSPNTCIFSLARWVLSQQQRWEPDLKFNRSIKKLFLTFWYQRQWWDHSRNGFNCKAAPSPSPPEMCSPARIGAANSVQASQATARTMPGADLMELLTLAQWVGEGTNVPRKGGVEEKGGRSEGRLLWGSLCAVWLKWGWCNESSADFQLL